VQAPPTQLLSGAQPKVPSETLLHAEVLAPGWQLWHGLLGFVAPAATVVPLMTHPPPASAALDPELLPLVEPELLPDPELLPLLEPELLPDPELLLESKLEPLPESEPLPLDEEEVASATPASPWTVLSFEAPQLAATATRATVTSRYVVVNLVVRTVRRPWPSHDCITRALIAQSSPTWRVAALSVVRSRTLRFITNAASETLLVGSPGTHGARAGTLEQPVLLPHVLRQGRRTFELGASLGEPTELLQQVRARAGEQMVASERRLIGQRIEDGQPGLWALGHRDGHGAIEPDDRGRCDGIELAVQRCDPCPVRLARGSCPRVAGRYRSLERVSRALVCEAFGSRKLRQPVLDEVSVPTRTVLIHQEHRVSGLVDTRRLEIWVYPLSLELERRELFVLARWCLRRLPPNRRLRRHHAPGRWRRLVSRRGPPSCRHSGRQGRLPAARNGKGAR
jgi:hypothetical protein